ncbi:MAG: hypothetical protein IKM97_05455 [Clostridia bacterium]|nr:hypothetical protein [Clostridia bacterium]
MEEKNVTKISLSTFFLILAIIAIVVMGIFIYKINNDKTLEIQKSTELQAQVNSLNGTVSDLQGKINSISETISSNNSSENNVKTNNETSNVATNTDTTTSNNNEDIKEVLQKYLDLSGALAGSPKNLLVELGLLNKNDTTGESVDVEGTPYITTNIKSSEFKSTMLKYVSEKCFEEEFERWFKFFDWVYYRDGGATGRSFEVVNVTKIGDSEYSAKVNEIMIDDSKETKEYKIKVINYNGKTVIDSCTEN